MAATVEIHPVLTRRDMDAFIRAAVKAQGSNPRWAQPLDMEAHEFFDPKHSPFAKENEMQCFVALRDGEPVGRIAAIVNKAYLDRHKDATGHFGFIEAIDDRDVFAALIEAAAAFLRARGLIRMSGPFSASINHEAGLLIEGFDEPHMVRTNYAPPYYGAQLESLGFTKAMDFIAIAIDVNDHLVDVLKRIRAMNAHWRHHDVLRTYGLTYLSWVSSFKRLLELYNDAWAENWGAVPISIKEADFIAKLMLPVIKPSWIRIAEWRGEPVAVVGQIPNANEAFAELSGKLLPFGWMRLMKRIHVTGTRTSRIPMAGIARKWRNTRVGQLAMGRLMAEAMEIARANRISMIEVSWMLEHNVMAIRGTELFGPRHSRRFRIYERAI